MKLFWIVCLTAAFSIKNTEAVIPLIGPAIAGGSAVVFGGYHALKCRYYECCTTREGHLQAKWIRTDLDDLILLEKDFKEQLYGQPLVEAIILKSLKAHLGMSNPIKPLVYSFHGATGSGKNHVSNIIANRLYIQGLKSKFVHSFVGTHFDDPSKAEYNKEKLRESVRSNVEQCPHQLFIFDEVDKAAPGLIDAIKPFLDYKSNIHGVDYRKSIFIFISNTGAKDITAVTYDFYERGKEREEITFQDFEKDLRKAAFNENGGFKTSGVIDKHLIDYYVPFFPLERKHVRRCIQDYIEKFNYTNANEAIIDEIADSVDYFPEDIRLYSKSGCKRIHTRVSFYLEN